jgi:hypothetical protein
VVFVSFSANSEIKSSDILRPHHFQIMILKSGLPLQLIGSKHETITVVSQTSSSKERNEYYKTRVGGVEGVVRGLEGIQPADSCILTKLE